MTVVLFVFILLPTAGLGNNVYWYSVYQVVQTINIHEDWKLPEMMDSGLHVLYWLLI